MAPKRKYLIDCDETIEPLRFYLGTPKHAYELLRCKDIGIDWLLFYRAWREGRTTRLGKNALTQLVSYFFLELRDAIEGTRWQECDFRLSDKTVERVSYWMRNHPPIGQQNNEEEDG